MISMICPRFPDASLTATTLGISANRSIGFIRIECRALTGRATRQEHVHKTVDLEIDEAAQSLFVNTSVVLERRDHRGSCSLKWLLGHWSPLQLHIIHCIDTLASVQPSCGGQCAERKSAPAFGDVAQFDRVRLGLEPDCKDTGNGAGARR